MSFILDFRGLYFCAANNLRRISTMYVRGYLQGSENGRVVTIAIYSDLQELLEKENLVAITN